MTAIYDNATPINRFGREWKPWTQEQIVRLISMAPMADTQKLLVSLSWGLYYAEGATGMLDALAMAGGLRPQEVKTVIPNMIDRERLAQDLARVVRGEFAGEGEPSDADPSRTMTSTGGESMQPSAIGSPELTPAG